MSKLKDNIDELIEAGVIDWNTGDKIRNYYENKPSKNSNRILIFFGILGALLVGLGIILIVAHNWDRLSISFKTVLAFTPLVIAQGICVMVKLKRNDSQAWKEGASVFLFLAVGAAMALISQVWQIEGDMRQFILTWLLLALPIMFLMPSSAVSLLVLVGVVQLGRRHIPNIGVPSIGNHVPLDQLGIYLACVLYYFLLLNRSARSLFTDWHHYAIPVVGLLIIVRSIIDFGPLSTFALLATFGILYNIGKLPFVDGNRLRRNPYLVIGSLGTVITLYINSFLGFWKAWREREGYLIDFNSNYIIFILLLIWLGLTVHFLMRKGIKQLNPIQAMLPFFILFPFSYTLSLHAGMIVSNLCLLTIGLYYFWQGNKNSRLTLLNYGMIIIAAVIISRFFEMDISFVSRGICFVIVGLAFFLANYFLIRKSKSSST